MWPRLTVCVLCTPSGRRWVNFWFVQFCQTQAGIIPDVEEKDKWWEQADWVRLNLQIQSLHIVPAHLFSPLKDTRTPSFPRSSALWLLRWTRPKRHVGHLGTFWVPLINPATCWHPTLQTSYFVLADGSQIWEGRFGYFGTVSAKTQSLTASQGEFLHINYCGLKHGLKCEQCSRYSSVLCIIDLDTTGNNDTVRQSGAHFCW